MLRLDAARDALADARAEALAARDAVHETLGNLAATRSSEGGIDAETVRALYWQHPEVHVEAIGRAAGLGTHEVYQHAGQSFTVTRPCTDCSVTLTITLTSRTAVARMAQSPDHYTFPSQCAECRERRYEERRLANEAAYAAWDDSEADAS